jgi:AcrR family transcriptional regulator
LIGRGEPEVHRPESRGPRRALLANDPEKARTRDSLRMQRSRHREAENRKDVLDAAEALFGHEGFREVSLSRVAEASEFSASALYKLFPTKLDLVAAVFERHRSAIEQCTQDDASETNDGVSQLLRSCRRIREYFETHEAFARLALQFLPDDLLKVSQSSKHLMRQAGIQPLVAALARAQQDGTVGGVGPLRCARQLLGMIIVDHALRQDSPATPDVAELVRRLVATSPSETSGRYHVEANPR